MKRKKEREKNETLSIAVGSTLRLWNWKGGDEERLTREQEVERREEGGQDPIPDMRGLEKTQECEEDSCFEWVMMVVGSKGGMKSETLAAIKSFITAAELKLNSKLNLSDLIEGGNSCHMHLKTISNQKALNDKQVHLMLISKMVEQNV